MVSIVIEGNIGAGKTTVCKKLSEYGFIVHEQRVHEWQYLQKYYSDNKKYVVPLQREIFDSYLNLKEPSKNENVQGYIYESNIFTAFSIFCKNQLLTNVMTLSDFRKISNDYHTHLKKPAVIIIIDTPVNVCLERIKKRDRSFEVCIESTLLQQLETRINEMVYDNCNEISFYRVRNTDSIEKTVKKVLEVIKIEKLKMKKSLPIKKK